MAPGAPGKAVGMAAVGIINGAAAAAAKGAPEVDGPSPAPRLKKLFLSSSGGAGKAPGSPGTCGTGTADDP